MAVLPAGDKWRWPGEFGPRIGFLKNTLNLPLQSSAINAILWPFVRDREVPPMPTTEGAILQSACSVLIVDRSPSTREVLETALERRGVRTLTAERPEAGLALARRYRPELIVLDLDDTPGCLPAGQQLTLAECSNEPASAEPPYRPRLVLLGNLRGWRELLPDGEFVPKPYHYGPLIRKIEQLLASANLRGTSGRADAVCDPRGRPGHSLRVDRVEDSSRAGCI
jgi:hypothetical protein